MTVRSATAPSRTAKAKQGFTLTEIAIVLGIIGLILGAIWTAAASVYSNQRTAHANTAILQIAQGVRTLYSSSSSTGYSSATDITSTLISAGAVPSDLINGTTLTGPFPNGATAIIATSDGQGFGISMSSVPKASCINLLTQVGGQTRDAGLFTASATTNAAPGVGDFSSTGTPLTTAVTPAIAAATAIGAAPSQQGGCTAVTSKVLFGFTIR